MSLRGRNTRWTTCSLKFTPRNVVSIARQMRVDRARYRAIGHRCAHGAVSFNDEFGCDSANG